MSDPTTPASSYADEAAAFDELLDQKLRGIRAQADDGTITMREAADLRVQALEHHIAAIRNLRAEHFGEEGDEQ
jgi:hypothetical protein